MLAKSLLEQLVRDRIVREIGSGTAIIMYDKRELYAVPIKNIIIDNENNSIEWHSPEYINSGGDIVHDKHYMKMDKVEVTLL